MQEAVKFALATLAYAVLHSLLASDSVKQMTARVVGERTYRGLYRLFYTIQALCTFGLLLVYGASLPRRLLYRIQGRPALLLRAGQLCGLLWAVWAAREVGIARLAGLTPFMAWLKQAKIANNAVAQGPELTQAGNLSAGGPFQWSRHPLNFAPLVLFWLTPKMTTRRLAFNLVSTLYLLMGSWHEELRLRAAYGVLYEKYQRSGVPFYWPRPRRKAQSRSSPEGI
jgi:methanethiol S-methyltransferase